MEQYEGNGAECMVKFIADGCKGHISVNDGRMLFGGVAWNVRAKKDVWEIDWLAEPCRYTPPEPQWVDCTMEEALDAHMSGKKIQIKNLSNPNWTDDGRMLPLLWHWAKPENKYRKEA